MWSPDLTAEIETEFARLEGVFEGPFDGFRVYSPHRSGAHHAPRKLMTKEQRDAKRESDRDYHERNRDKRRAAMIQQHLKRAAAWRERHGKTV